ncbi:MAG: extracellular solute-binding protein [Hyphomicrobiales bacterium]|nr:extracellular solute-binding protein [Hyphomicrobiales bacterium]
MNNNRLGFFCGRFAAVTFLVSVMTWVGAYAQENNAGSEESVVVPASAGNEITFTSWTGPYMRSQMLGFVRPYEAMTGVKVNVEHYAGGIDEIRDQVESANVVWDVVDLTQADSLRACEGGLLEILQDLEMPDGVDGSDYRDDFVEGALNPCGIGVIVWATAFAYSSKVFGDDPPATISDFFDTEKYPGPRAIRDDPTVVMEWALIADGVAPNDVYGVLATPEGIKRALSKMDAIKPGLVLWQDGLDPVRLLNGDEVSMSMVWATTGAVASREEGADFSMVWDGRVIELDLFGIPKGSQNMDAAIDFIRFASSSESLASMVSYLPNGPTRKSSLALISDEVLSQLPNGPAYADKVSILSNAQWWSEHDETLEEAFNAWIAGSARQGASGTVR